MLKLRWIIAVRKPENYAVKADAGLLLQNGTVKKYNKQKPFLQDYSARNKINGAALFYDKGEYFPVFHAWSTIRALRPAEAL
jgi:hypothetical protein